MSARWPGGIFDNLGLKLFALLLAVLLYLHVLTDRVVEKVVYFPVEVENLADTLALATMPPPEVGVKLRGTGKQVLRLMYLKPPVLVSLGGVGPGTFQRALEPGDVPLDGADDVSVLEVVDPREFSVEVALRRERRLPVAVAVVGQPARGFVVAGDPVVRPPRVRLSGPAPWLARQESLRTEPVNIAGRRGPAEVLQPLVPPPDWATAFPGSVLIEVPIEPEVTRELRVAVEVRGIRGELSADVRPEAVRATWRGPRSAAEGLDEARFSARVDAGRRGRGQWRLPVALDGPRAGFVTVEPESVLVVLR